MNLTYAHLSKLKPSRKDLGKKIASRYWALPRPEKCVEIRRARRAKDTPDLVAVVHEDGRFWWNPVRTVRDGYMDVSEAEILYSGTGWRAERVEYAHAKGIWLIPPNVEWREFKSIPVKDRVITNGPVLFGPAKQILQAASPLMCEKDTTTYDAIVATIKRVKQDAGLRAKLGALTPRGDLGGHHYWHVPISTLIADLLAANPEDVSSYQPLIETACAHYGTYSARDPAGPHPWSTITYTRSIPECLDLLFKSRRRAILKHVGAIKYK